MLQCEGLAQCPLIRPSGTFSHEGRRDVPNGHNSPSSTDSSTVATTSASNNAAATGSAPGASLVSRNVVATTPPRPTRFSPLIAAGLCTQRSEEHPSELQSLIPNSFAVFCFKKKKTYI